MIQQNNRTISLYNTSQSTDKKIVYLLNYEIRNEKKARFFVVLSAFLTASEMIKKVKKRPNEQEFSIAKSPYDSRKPLNKAKNQKKNESRRGRLCNFAQQAIDFNRKEELPNTQKRVKTFRNTY